MATKLSFRANERPNFRQTYNPDNGGWGPKVVGYIRRPRTSSITYGPSVKNYREAIARGDDATTHASGVRYKIHRWQPGYAENIRFYVYRTINSGWFDSGNCPDFPAATYTPSSKALTMAETNFAKSYRKVTQVAQLGTTLGELGELTRLLANPVRSLYGLTETLAKDLKKAKRFLKPRLDGGQLDRYEARYERQTKAYRQALSDAWLTYQFGAKPAASEANSFMEAIRSIDAARTYELRRIYGEYTDKRHESTTWETQNVTGGGALVNQEVRTTFESKVIIRGAIKVRGEMPPMQTLGLSVLDIVPTAWELIPFSFLLDYFSNAGDTLDALMLRFVDFSWLNQTVRNRRTATYGPFRALPLDSGDTSRIAYGGQARFSTTTFQRASRDNNFGGGLVFKAPGLGSLKWLNIAALTQTVLGSRP